MMDRMRTLRRRRRSGGGPIAVAGSIAAAGLIAAVPAHRPPVSWPPALHAQSPQLPAIGSQQRHARGRNVVPLYRGWFTGEDGRIYAAFEYLNLNSDETLHVPVGPDNALAPGPADQGQPAWFLPGHRRGVFAAPVPEGPGPAEVTWTLRVRGRTITMPSNLGPLYEIEGLVNHGGSFPGNTPPVVRLAPDGPPAQGPAGTSGAIEARAGEAAPLDLWVTDDGLPPPPDRSKVIRSLQRSYRRGDASAEGVTVAWTRYRGTGTVSFSDPDPPVEQGRAGTTATFDQPGEYVLRALVSDGSGFDGCCWTNVYVAAVVRPAGR